MASFWEKAISILAGNLNSGRSYLITAVLTAHSAARSLHEAIMRSEYRLSRPWTTTEGFGAFFRGSLSDMLKAGLAGHTVHFHEFHLRHKLYFGNINYWSYMVHKDCKINSIHYIVRKGNGILERSGSYKGSILLLQNSIVRVHGFDLTAG